MAEILLQTKLFVPVTRSHLVPRPQLLKRLNVGLSGRFTLISAPAGFGKTTLIAHWGQQLAQANDWHFAWLALDENDNDVGRFFTYFIATLQKVNGRLAQSTLEQLQTAKASNIQLILTNLLNDLAQSTPAIMLVLDDYHLITNPTIHEGIVFLIEHAPPHFHLIITSRADPPFSLVRFRVRHQLTEIRQDDLRFSLREVESFLNELMALDLPQTAVDTLEQRTEGWIAGLQMAALSLQGHPDSERFLTNFTGSHRYIFDYLAEEVLARHPAGTREFLLQTAVLDRLCAPLCATLLEIDDTSSQKILEQLEVANFFLVPLDDSRHWYRYHHLFADLLRQFLRREMPEQERALHGRASRWFKQAGFVHEAIEHALKADELTRAAALMEPITHGMAYRMENERLGRWIRALPDELLLDYPGIVFPYAVTLSATGQFRAYRAFLEKMAEVAHANSDSSAARHILGHIGIHACITLHHSGEYDEALVKVAKTEALLRQYGQPHERWELISIMGYSTNHVVGAAAVSLGHLARAIELAVADQGSIGPTLCHTFTANVLMQQGRLHQAATHLQTAVQAATSEAESQQLHAIFPATMLARLHYERNELEEAAKQVAQYQPLADVFGFTLDPLDTLLVQMMLPLLRGDKETAVSQFTNAAQQFRERPIGSGFRQRLDALEALLWLRSQQQPRAIQWADSIHIPEQADNLRPMDVLVYLIWVRVRLAQQQPEAVIDLLAQLHHWATGQGLVGIVLETAVLQALAAHAQNDIQTTLSHLQTALTHAEQEGYVRLFLDEGEAIGFLLETAVQHNIVPTYATHLLQQFTSTASENISLLPVPLSPPSSLSASLSPREIEVLQLLAQGLTNKTIGAKLFIAPSTVKRHTINIYNKLGVNGRTEATARAYELRLVERGM